VTRPSSATDASPRGEDACRPLRADRAPHSPADRSGLGRSFAQALARRDFGELGALLHPAIEFRALTPRRAWAPESHGQVVEVFRTWFGACDVEHVLRLDTDTVADRRHVAYRFRVYRPDGRFVIEQQAYYDERDGQINWMRVTCSGFRVA
jgi:hypothetical protein